MNYFKGKVSPGFVSLFSGKAIIDIASGFFGLFLPIFLFEIFGKEIRLVAGYYLFGSVLYLFLVAYGARLLNRFGFRNALRLSSFFGALYYLTFYFVKADNIWLFLPLLLVIITIWRMLFWVPYNVDFAKFSSKKNRGKEVILMEIVLSFIGIFTPIIAGFVISHFGFGVLFVFGIFVYLISLIPFSMLPRTKEKFSWKYKETWKKLFCKEQRGETFAFIFEGAENAISIAIWPIFIFQALSGSFLKVGALSTLVVAITIVLQLVSSRYIDDGQMKRKIFKYGGFLYAIGWGIKVFVGTFFQIFLVDSFHRFSGVFFKAPFNTITLETASEQKHYVDEFTVLREMAIAIGKIGMFVLVIGLVSFVSLKWVFVLAFFASLFLSLIGLQGGKYLNKKREE